MALSGITSSAGYTSLEVMLFISKSQMANMKQLATYLQPNITLKWDGRYRASP